jgi:drug/metabolite transporter (DMT)-like permease
MTTKNRALILGIITVACWGSLATFGNLLIHLPPFYVLGCSFLMGSLPSLPYYREMFPSWKIVLWGVFGYFGYHFFLFYSFRFAPAVEANLINYMWPVLMVMLTPWFFPEERLRWYHFMGAMLAIIGCALLVFGAEAESRGENVYLGYLLAAGAALTWPIYSIGKKKLAPTSVWAVGGFCLGASACCFITHSLIEPHVVLQFHDAWKLVLMGIGPFGVAFYCWDKASALGDTKILGALSYLSPVISTLALVFFAGKSLSPITGLAMVLIIGGASAGLLDFLPSNTLKKP